MTSFEWIAKHQAISAWLGILLFVIAGPIALWWFNTHGGGEYAGAVVGFCALLAGALYNAELERRRDERLHKRDILAAVTAILDEVQRNTVIASTAIDEINSGKIVNIDDISIRSDALVNSVYMRNVELLVSAMLITENTICTRLIEIMIIQCTTLRGISANIKRTVGSRILTRSELQSFSTSFDHIMTSGIEAGAELKSVQLTLRPTAGVI